MISYLMDPDVVRWGLNQLCISPVSRSSSHSTITRFDEDLSHREFVHEAFFEDVPVDVESDEVIARALQEEFSRVADVEQSTGCSNEGQQQLRDSILTQDWRCPSQRQGTPDMFPSSDHASNAEETIEITDEEGTSNSVASPDILIAEDSCPDLPEMTDESALDDEVGKRLNHMIPVAHVPKVNEEIPSADYAESAHQRLLDRLKVYDLVELKVKGDGNCQFRALSDQIYRSPEYHSVVRQQVVDQLKSHQELYEGYVPMPYADYLKKMSKSSEWGDHVTLQAAADTYGVKIFVLTSFKDTCYVEINPGIPKSNRVICLSFWAEVHYNSIYPEGEFPPQECKKKKWRFFGK